VHLTARRQMRSIAALHASVNQTELRNKLEERKKTVTLSIVVIGSVVLYCPFVTFKIISLIKDTDSNTKYLFEPIAMTCIHLQSILNPLIVSLRLTKIRAGVLKKLRCSWFS
jgi:hypothetical protein